MVRLGLEPVLRHFKLGLEEQIKQCKNNALKNDNKKGLISTV